MSEITDAFIDLSSSDAVVSDAKDEQLEKAPSQSPEAGCREVVSDAKDEQLEKARDINRTVVISQKRYLDSAEKTKQFKKAWEAKQNYLSDYLTSLDTPPNPQLGLPLKDRSETWRNFPLADVSGLSPTALVAMGDIELVTMGDLADWFEFHVCTDLKGVGESGASRIEKSLSEFWADHPEWCPDYQESKEALQSPPGEDLVEKTKDLSGQLKNIAHELLGTENEKPRRGRPPGSKNKLKSPNLGQGGMSEQ